MLRNRIKSWINIQAVYIPCSVFLHINDTNAATSDADLQSFNIKLWLPSSIGSLGPCPQILRDYEWKLREAQAVEALGDLRSHLRLWGFLWKRKKDWAHSVRENNRSDAAIKNARGRVDWSAQRYRTARSAMEALVQIATPTYNWEERFPVLKDDDIRNLSFDAVDLGEGRTAVSWIWSCQGIGDEQSLFEDVAESESLPNSVCKLTYTLGSSPT
jgi:hypothetical protein